MSPVVLSEVQASLSLFAEAIMGQPVAFEAVDDYRLCWPWSPSDPDAHEVRVPSSLQAHEADTDVRITYRSLVLHQLVGGEVVGEHLTATIAERRASGHGHDRHMLEAVYAIVEDTRVVASTRRRYPGAIAELDRVLGDARTAAGDSNLPAEDRPEWLAALHQCSLGVSVEQVVGARPNIDERAVGELQRELAGVQSEHATRSDSWATAVRICTLMAAIGAGTPGTEMVGDVDSDQELPALPSEENDGVSLDGGTPSEFEEVDGLSGGQPLSDGTDQGTPVVESERTVMPGVQVPTTGPRAVGQQVRTFVYDEWDYHQGAHRPAWCRVVEEQLAGDDLEFLAEVRSRHVALRAQIRRRFARMPPSDLVRVYRSDDGDELDLDAVIEARADRRGGAPADDRLHVRRDRAARDVATAFLLDLSASTSSAAVPTEPEPLPPDADPFDDPMSYGAIWDTPPKTEPVRRVLDVAKDAVALMGDALHELGDRYAIYGFSGTGRDHVEFKIGKDFGDRSSPTTWASVAAMKPLRYTRMGPAVRHATTKLAAESARTKLLIVISDGYPQDTDYGADRHDRNYGVHDTARALADAEDRGIETFCVTIDPAGHDYLRTMCPDHRYAVIDDVESLPEELAKLYLLRLASH